MAFKKITKRWIFNSLGIILFILITIEIVAAFGMKGYFYNNVRQAVKSRADVISTLLTKYGDDSSVNFPYEVRNLVESFSDRDKMELMALDPSGKVTITSSGFEPGSDLYMPDFTEAVSSNNKYGEFIGVVNGENIMAITVLSPVVNESLSAMRFVVSLTKVDNQIILFIIVITAICFAILFFVILSSSYFINSIVIPIGQVGQSAKRIALGDFNSRIKKKTDDEIGELCDAINHMAQELSNAEKMKNDFISSVSHELRTPLTAIKGWSETLMTDDLDTQMRKKGMGVILNETQRLSSMVEELLDFSRMQSGRLNLIMEKLDIVAELSDAVLMFTERASREGIELIYEEPADFVVVYGDKNRLRQVFINIIDNALKYSDSGDSVTISAFVANDQFVITVCDTGCGIKQEDLPKVKTKFYKGNSTRRGSGIGLAIADEIIGNHGGTLSLQSRESEGTTVTISLPVNKKPEEPPKQQPILN